MQQTSDRWGLRLQHTGDTLKYEVRGAGRIVDIQWDGHENSLSVAVDLTDPEMAYDVARSLRATALEIERYFDTADGERPEPIPEAV